MMNNQSINKQSNLVEELSRIDRLEEIEEMGRIKQMN